MWWDCIIPELRFKMYLEVSAPMKVVDCIIPEPQFKMYPEVSAPVKVVDCIIPGPRFKMYLKVSAPMKVWIASSLNLGSKCIWRYRPP